MQFVIIGNKWTARIYFCEPADTDRECETREMQFRLKAGIEISKHYCWIWYQSFCQGDVYANSEMSMREIGNCCQWSCRSDGSCDCSDRNARRTRAR